MNELQLHELLDGFLDKRVSYSQLQVELEQQTGAADVAALVQQHTLAAAAVEQFGILQSIKHVRKQYEQAAAPVVQFTPRQAEETPVVRINWMRRAMAIASVFLVGAALWSVISLSTYSADEMYTDLNETYALNTVRNSAIQNDDDLVAAFRQNDYKKVVTLYQAGATNSSREKFFAGYAYMQLEDYTNAGVTLEKLLEVNSASGQLLYNDDAEYYLALSRMQLGNYESAYKILKRIYNQPAHTYNSNVSLMQLAKLWLMK